MNKTRNMLLAAFVSGIVLGWGVLPASAAYVPDALKENTLLHKQNNDTSLLVAMQTITYNNASYRIPQGMALSFTRAVKTKTIALPVCSDTNKEQLKVYIAQKTRTDNNAIYGGWTSPNTNWNNEAILGTGVDRVFVQDNLTPDCANVSSGDTSTWTTFHSATSTEIAGDVHIMVVPMGWDWASSITPRVVDLKWYASEGQSATFSDLNVPYSVTEFPTAGYVGNAQWPTSGICTDGQLGAGWGGSASCTPYYFFDFLFTDGMQINNAPRDTGTGTTTWSVGTWSMPHENSFYFPAFQASTSTGIDAVFENIGNALGLVPQWLLGGVRYVGDFFSSFFSYLIVPQNSLLAELSTLNFASTTPFGYATAFPVLYDRLMSASSTPWTLTLDTSSITTRLLAINSHALLPSASSSLVLIDVCAIDSANGNVYRDTMMPWLSALLWLAFAFELYVLSHRFL